MEVAAGGSSRRLEGKREGGGEREVESENIERGEGDGATLGGFGGKREREKEREGEKEGGKEGGLGRGGGVSEVLPFAMCRTKA
jgi:hypothetical protein